MVSPLPHIPTVDLLQKAAEFGERRHDVLAGNIANISTPTYRMRDLPVQEFQTALRAAVAVQRGERSRAAEAGSPSAQTGTTLDDLFADRLFRPSEESAGNITFQDANNRSLERQVMEMVKNSTMQNFALQLIRFQLNSMHSVISEQP